MSKQTVVVLITGPLEKADEIAEAIVKAKLAACVNVVRTIRSVYWWEGEMQHDDEALLLVKTTQEAVEPMVAAVRQVHPYENFELIALPIATGAPAYLDWIVDSTKAS